MYPKINRITASQKGGGLVQLVYIGNFVPVNLPNLGSYTEVCYFYY